MAQLPVFIPSSFSDETFDSNILEKLDQQFASIKAVLDATRSNLAKVQRDDTKLGNQVVHKDAMAPETLALFASTWNPRGAWLTSTEYKRLDSVTQDGETWICTLDHTSGVFATDQGAGLWMAVTSSSSAAGLLSLSSAGTASAYTITTGESYSGWSNVPPILVDWHVSNNDNATINIDGLGPKNLKIEGTNVSSGDLSGQDIVVYDVADDAVIVVARDLASSGVEPSVQTAITANKTITNADLIGVSHYVLPMNISSGSGLTLIATLPAAAAANKNKFVTVKISADAGTLSDNQAQLKTSGGTELWTGWQKHDFATFISDGGAWVYIDDKATIEAILTLTSDETVAAQTSVKVYDAGYSADKNIGKFFDSTTNHRFDSPSVNDTLIFEVNIVWVASREQLSVYPKHSGTGVAVDVVTDGVWGSSIGARVFHVSLTSGQNFDFEAFNGDPSSSADLKGDPGKKQTQIRMRLIGRVR